MTLLSELLWRRTDEHALEVCRLLRSPDAYVLEGRVLTMANGHPAEVHYTVHVGPEWITRAGHVSVVQGAGERQVIVERDEAGRWRVDGEPRPEFDGIPDIDLEFTPATNTLPIRRLALPVGESRPSDAVWVRFPGLTCERLQQRYTRLDDRRYLYETADGAFSAELAVDEHGVVERYGDIWRRVAE